MAAYVFSEVEVINEDAANRYRQLAASSIAKYEGRYLVRGAKAFVVEGDSMKRRVIIVEFPSIEKIHEWYASPEYAEALKFRGIALTRRLLFVEGVDSKV
jgi:uncharacterized protein (DUF1330 family)